MGLLQPAHGSPTPTGGSARPANKYSIPDSQSGIQSTRSPPPPSVAATLIAAVQSQSQIFVVQRRSWWFGSEAKSSPGLSVSLRRRGLVCGQRMRSLSHLSLVPVVRWRLSCQSRPKTMAPGRFRFFVRSGWGWGFGEFLGCSAQPRSVFLINRNNFRNRSQCLCLCHSLSLGDLSLNLRTAAAASAGQVNLLSTPINYDVDRFIDWINSLTTRDYSHLLPAPSPVQPRPV